MNKPKEARDENRPVLTSELARDLGVSRATAYVICRSGEMPARFWGGRYEIDRSIYAEALAAYKAERSERR